MISAAKRLILIPTYNERENIEPLIRALRSSVPTADLLVIDDHSPDGTGAIVERLAAADPAVRLLARPRKEGLGRAYVAGFRAALAHRDYADVVTMDADGSHRPADVPKLLAAGDERTVTIGSRYVPGGRIRGWGFNRYLISWVANVVTRTALGIRARDASAGFKRYPRAFLETIDLDHVIAAGYAFQVEMLMKAQAAGFRLREVPITFVDRRAGQSKIAGEAARSIRVILTLAWQRRGLRQFVKFCLVGLLNVGVDWTAYFLLNRLLGLPKLSAKFGSFVVAASNSYLLNRRWTFRSTDRRVGRQLAKFFAVSAVGAGLNTGIFWLTSLQLGAPELVGLAVATALVTVWNFAANKAWTFRPSRRR
jgi:dolichol-phosphate mannosyltransferase